MSDKQLSPGEADQFRTYHLGTNQTPPDTLFAVITVTGPTATGFENKEYWELVNLAGWVSHSGNLRLLVHEEASDAGFSPPPHTFEGDNTLFQTITDGNDWVYETPQNQYYTFDNASGHTACLVVRLTSNPASVTHIAFMRPTGAGASLLMESSSSRSINRMTDPAFMADFTVGNWNRKGVVKDG